MAMYLPKTVFDNRAFLHPNRVASDFRRFECYYERDFFKITFLISLYSNMSILRRK